MGIPHVNQLPKQNPLVRALHTAVKGRARYKVDGLHRSEAFKRYLELRLSDEKGIQQVSANHYTGNVLVLFPSDRSPNAIASLIQNIVFDYRQQIEKSLLKSEAEKIPAVVSKAILAETPLQQPIDKAGRQLILLSGTAVGTLIACTVLLHKFGLDESILLAIQRLHTPLLDRIMVGITSLGGSAGLPWICLAFATSPIYYNRRSEVITFGVATLGAMALNYLLKEQFGRARPSLWDWIINVGHHSFPSGHAMMSMVVYGFIAYTLAKEFPHQRKQIFTLTILLIAAIGFSRLYLGVHWPTDVAAGYAAGLLWLIVCIFGFNLWQKSRLSKQILTLPTG
ncbi:phosphatase PAP2 family protein [Scytonema sp. UIC 10036]|uniref:phosphatase PAP2 family protein n=1 Tax=Scytonema sp. UIC 10036 TaxID=2304196 RepID=UPI0012DAA4D9|nr:phosphatase PAP2 family protein [Scytonema sp. UIC 10036]MUG93233.1 phosphatase PAP2 family protein [Scytonema sp. UIC 10036]